MQTSASAVHTRRVCGIDNSTLVRRYSSSRNSKNAASREAPRQQEVGLWKSRRLHQAKKAPTLPSLSRRQSSDRGWPTWLRTPLIRGLAWLTTERAGLEAWAAEASTPSPKLKNAQHTATFYQKQLNVLHPCFFVVRTHACKRLLVRHSFHLCAAVIASYS